ncbi:hypothetical protein I317_04962 [Kwoniella heveanensis CBS 569]|nr:hypothetical protein I317_04962 [Kwoniella heveanensis CBS 569]
MEFDPISAGDRLRGLLAQLIPTLSVPSSCFSCLPLLRSRSSRNSKRLHDSPSFTAEAQEGELETLLNLNDNDEGWDEDDCENVGSQTRILTSKTRFSRGSGIVKRPPQSLLTMSKRGFTVTSPASAAQSQSQIQTQSGDDKQPPSYDPHLHPPPPEQSESPSPSPYQPSTSTSRAILTHTYTHTKFDDDPESLTALDPRELADIAKRFEPPLTMEDIEREEAEQAEREGVAEGAYTLPLGRGGGGAGVGGGAEDEAAVAVEAGKEDGNVVDEDFGEFESGHGGNDGVGVQHLKMSG